MNNQILFADYERHYANIQETLAALLKKARERLGELQVSASTPAPADWPFPVI